MSTLTSFATIAPAPIDWLWQNYIPAGLLTLLLGNPSAGKSSLAFDLAARLSLGSTAPPKPILPLPPVQTPGSTLLIAPGAPADSILRPRLESLVPQLDLQRIHLLANFPGFNCDQDIATFQQALDNIPELSFIIIDPFSHYFPRWFDRDAAHAHSALHYLTYTARSRSLPILLTAPLPPSFPSRLNAHGIRPRALATFPSHLFSAIHLLLPTSDHNETETKTENKNENENKDKTPSNTSDDTFLSPDPATRLLFPLKSPAPIMPAPLAFTLAETLTWSTTLPDHPLAPPDPALQQAKQFLRALLHDGPLSSNHVHTASIANGIAIKTLHRAKGNLHIASSRKNIDSPWYWSFRGDSRPPHDSVTKNTENSQN